MADDFDLNDRGTWNWVDEVVNKPRANGDVRLDPVSPHSFYQYSDGVPFRHMCPRQDEMTQMVFNPESGTCDWSRNATEAMIYDWCVKNGYIAPDQR